MRLKSLLLTRRSFVTALAAHVPLHSLQAQDIRYTRLAHPKTHFDLKRYSSRRQWQARRSHLRHQILGAAGLLPFPDRDTIQSQIVKCNLHDNFCTEAVLIETLPGYYVGGTVYRPLDTTRRWPAVLIPHGHWKHGRVEDIPSYSVPALGINLALQGYVALAWDMTGYNDTKQTPHDFGGWREQLWAFNPLGLQLWNSIRALDYVLSRPDVDGRRIACTGASGGATQTILLTAVDNRVTCSAPVNMISAIYQGADPCEEAPNLRLGTNNVEIASMMAPRPMLMVSCTGDWTHNTPRQEYPAVKSTYALFDRADYVENAHFNADHNYDRNTREAVYRFLSKHMLGQPGASFTEQPAPDIESEELLSLTSGIAPPDDALEYDALFAQWRALFTKQDVSRTALRTACGAQWPTRVGASEFGERLILTRIGKKDRVPALWLRGRGTPAVIIHPDGLQAARESPELKQIREAGRPVLAIDVFQTGVAQAPREEGGRWYLSYNQTDDANRVQDILTALAWLRSQTKDEPELIGIGSAALWVVLAAAIAPRQPVVIADLTPFENTDDVLRDHCFIPCLQRAGGIAGATKLLRNLRPKLS